MNNINMNMNDDHMKGSDVRESLLRIEGGCQKLLSLSDYGMKRDSDFITPDKVSEDGVRTLKKRRRKILININTNIEDIQDRLRRTNKLIEKTQTMKYNETIMRKKLKTQTTLKQQKIDTLKEYKEKKKKLVEEEIEITYEDEFDDDDEDILGGSPDFQ
jgi:hypothetical protein